MNRKSATNQEGDSPNYIAQAPPAQDNQKAEKMTAGGCQQRLVLPIFTRELLIDIGIESQKNMWEGMTDEDIAVTIGNAVIRKWGSVHGEKYGRIGGELTYVEVRDYLKRASRQKK